MFESSNDFAFRYDHFITSPLSGLLRTPLVHVQNYTRGCGRLMVLFVLLNNSGLRVSQVELWSAFNVSHLTHEERWRPGWGARDDKIICADEFTAHIWFTSGRAHSAHTPRLTVTVTHPSRGDWVLLARRIKADMKPLIIRCSKKKKKTLLHWTLSSSSAFKWRGHSCTHLEEQCT